VTGTFRRTRGAIMSKKQLNRLNACPILAFW
jgi:hypothetical protein